MKSEIIKQRILTADDGKFLTNGESVVKTVVLPADADASVWYEITEVEKEKMEAAENGI